MAARLIFLLVSVIGLTVLAQNRHDYSHRYVAPKPGPCPNIGPVDNFQLNKFLGNWYHLFAADRLHWNTSMHCVQREYLHKDNSDQVDVVKYYILDGRPVWESASHILVPGHPGTFEHGFPKNESSTQQFFHRVQFHIIDTDYDSYAAVWGCFHDEKRNEHFETGGISSRSISLPVSTVEAIKKKFQDGGSSIEFEPIPYQDCRAKCAST